MGFSLRVCLLFNYLFGFCCFRDLNNRFPFWREKEGPLTTMLPVHWARFDIFNWFVKFCLSRSHCNRFPGIDHNYYSLKICFLELTLMPISLEVPLEVLEVCMLWRLS